MGILYTSSDNLLDNLFPIWLMFSISPGFFIELFTLHWKNRNFELKALKNWGGCFNVIAYLNPAIFIFHCCFYNMVSKVFTEVLECFLPLFLQFQLRSVSLCYHFFWLKCLQRPVRDRITISQCFFNLNSSRWGGRGVKPHQDRKNTNHNLKFTQEVLPI